MTVYAPGTNETDPKKQNRAIQAAAAAVQTNIDAITAINAASYVNTIAGNSGAFTLNAPSGITNATNDIKLSQGSASQFGAVKVDGTTITAASGVIANSTAVKSDQTTATSTSKSVTPAVQQNHPSSIKVWVDFTPGASPAINASYNVTSITRNGTGDHTVNFTTSFADTNFAVSCISVQPTGTTGVLSCVTAIAVGSVRISTFNTAGASGDPSKIKLICAGNQ